MSDVPALPHGMEPKSTEINIGNPQEWLNLYTHQYECDAELNAAGEAISALMPEMEAFSAVTHLELELGDTEALMHKALSGEATDFGERVVAVQKRGTDAFEKVQAVYGEVGFKEWELGSELEAVEPAVYITRAIGQAHPAVRKRWNQVRAEIEVFRILTGETRADRTLGFGVDEPWAHNKLANTVLFIHSIQVAQILLSEDPLSTARQFGKEVLIEELGLPPKHTPEEIGAILDQSSLEPWAEQALKLAKQLEPLELGLTLDRE